MRRYEDPQAYVDRYMARSAETYVNGLRNAGLQPNATLTRAIAERALQEAGEDSIREVTDIRDSTITAILRDHTQRMNAIKKEGARLRLWMCLPVVLALSAGSWYSFTCTGFIMGMCYAGGALAFLAMLVLGALFDRPE
ncbi:MAG: hypothetical protein H0W02_18835 [Ktedonobacteraceae bacterium]|nr:hypothetical protein [Ktedonobacteraceae bacterium]